jgi:hypothetical protein
LQAEVHFKLIRLILVAALLQEVNKENDTKEVMINFSSFECVKSVIYLMKASACIILLKAKASKVKYFVSVLFIVYCLKIVGQTVVLCSQKIVFKYLCFNVAK